MILKVTVENFKSFDQREELSMISSSKIQSHPEHKCRVGQASVLKNAVIYGANASGKTNFVDAVEFIRSTLGNGMLKIDDQKLFCRNNKNNEERESFFELQFVSGKHCFAYGFSAVLSQRRVTEEWIYELLQNGEGRELFTCEAGKPRLGKEVRPGAVDQKRFEVYADEFTGQQSKLFLTKMNRLDKGFSADSKLFFFHQIYSWFMDHLVIIRPGSVRDVFAGFEDEDTVRKASRIIAGFDTGIDSISVGEIDQDRARSWFPGEILDSLLKEVKAKAEQSEGDRAGMSFRMADNILHLRVEEGKCKFYTLMIHHSHSPYVFTFAEESNGTRRLIDLISLLFGKDTVYLVDELERSLHPKLTEHFLELFSTLHEKDRTQLIFTTHEDSIMDQDLFRRDEIWFVERDITGSSHLYPLDRFKERYDRRLRKAYLDGRYGAIPVFGDFSFEEE